MRVGIVGAGQLARMLAEAASALGIETVVLAESDSEGAAKTATELKIGSPHDRAAMEDLAQSVDVVTFDHELVDLEIIAELESSGVRLSPSSSALLYAVDKAEMRSLLHARGLPCPAFEIIAPGDTSSAKALGEQFGWPFVIKAARGGYDGKGVFVVQDATEAADVIASLHERNITALIEENVEIVSELAALICRSHDGEIVAWPVVETAQFDGVCREVLIPGSLSEQHRLEGEAIARAVGDVVGVVGIMAVELFVTKDGLLINELAMRPHNSGHWTQDGSVTSQFENHLRAVANLPLGSTEVNARAVASVNIFGTQEGGSLDGFLGAGLKVEGAHIHLYGKESRKGRKLGHVTVCGSNPDDVRNAAWESATALGTEVPHQIGEQIK